MFTCNYEGNPVKTIGWLKDGKNLNHEDGTLRIDAVKKEDKGMYQCFVRNDQESAQACAELKLGGRCEYSNIYVIFKNAQIIVSLLLIFDHYIVKFTHIF